MSTRFNLLALAFCLFPAATWAQVAYNASGPYYTNSNATAYQSGSAGQTSCTADSISCPTCNSQNITNAEDSNYQVLCGSYISSSAISQQSGSATPLECITACDGFFGCTGAYISKQGACSLSVGQILGTIKSEEYTAFISIGDAVPANTSASSPATSISTSIALTAGTTVSLSTYTPPAPFPNITHPTPYQPPNISYPNPFGPKSPYASGTGLKPTGIVSPHPPQYNTSNPPPWLVNATYGPNFTWPNTTLPSPSLANITYHPPNATYANSTALSTTHPTPLFPNATFPNTTFPNTTLPAPPTPLHLNGTNQTCSIKNLQCPACNNHTITDSHNATYAVLCGYSLSSTSQFAFAEPLPAQYCLARCDERNVTCAGAHWSDQECTLALGTLKAPIRDPDYIAFIRVNAKGVVPPTASGASPVAPARTGSTGTGSLVTGTGSGWHSTGGIPLALTSTAPTWPNMSTFGGYASGLPRPTASPSLISTGLILATAPAAASSVLPSVSLISSTLTSGADIITITSTVSPEPTCNPGAISCPECDGLRIVDTANETYRLQCNFKPTCDKLVGFYGLAGLNVCMQRCDKDAACLAAVFNQGHCDICQHSMEGEYDEDVDYLVLIPETPEEASISATLGTATITSSIAALSTSGATTPIATTLSVATPVFPTSSAPNITTLSATTLSNATPISLFPTASCNATAPMCPECNGITHTDPNGVEYKLDCDAVCTTQSLWAPRGMISRDTCLSTCDNNPSCVAANYNPFGCGSCRNITYDNITPEASYLVYVKKSTALPANPEVEQSAPTGWENSPPILPMSFPLSTPTPTPLSASIAPFQAFGSAQPAIATASNPFAVSCPKNDNASYRALSGRSFNIACESVLEADEISQTSATSFQDCVAACTGHCGGVQFAEAYGGCLLMTSVSVVANSASWTAAVAVTWPGTAGPDIMAPTGGMGKTLALTTATVVPLSSEGAIAASSTAVVTSSAAVVATSTAVRASSTPAIASITADAAGSALKKAPDATGAPAYGGRPWGGPPGGFPGGSPNGRPQGPPGWWAGGRGGGPWWGGWGRGRPGRV